MKAAFDDAAKNYDADFTFSLTGAAQREIVYNHLFKSKKLKSPLSILEINCGTGEDACFLASMGHDVIATDVSNEMISVAKAKAIKKDIQRGLRFEVCDFENLASIAGDEKFDLVFSNFGGLNCIDSEKLKSTLDSIHKVLKKDGVFIAVVMGRFCLWESLYFIFKLQFNKVFRRFNKNGIAVGLTNSVQHTYYYSPREFANLCSGKFIETKLRPVGFFIPPSYLEPFFKKHLKLFSFLKMLDNKFEKRIFSKMSDHYFIELVRLG